MRDIEKHPMCARTHRSFAAWNFLLEAFWIPIALAGEHIGQSQPTRSTCSFKTLWITFMQWTTSSLFVRIWRLGLGFVLVVKLY